MSTVVVKAAHINQLLIDSPDRPHPFYQSPQGPSTPPTAFPRSKKLPLGVMSGFKDMGLNMIRAEKGGIYTTLPHSHRMDDEWIYIIDGTARLLLIYPDGSEEWSQVSKGDILLFKSGPNQMKHALKTSYDTDLLYLCGGNRSKLDICDYAKHEELGIGEPFTATLKWDDDGNRDIEFHKD